MEPPKALTYKELERHIQAQQPDDELYIRVTKPKLRMPWSEERLAKFLTCPIYTGCFSEHRRWKRGSMIIRDATYWVPLIVLTLGSRIAEILLLKRTDIRFRNNAYCFAIGSGLEQPGKTEDSKRIVPIPQLLLDLGFIEWFQALPDSHGVLLFPEAARRTTSGDVTSAFGKHLRRILERLDLADFDEDFYAMRKTLLSMLRSASVSDGQRQAIAGHKHGSILNVHYTAHQTHDLKAAVDKADFKLEIGRRRKYGFPVILRCNLAQQEELKVDVTINDDGQAASVRIQTESATDPVFEFVKQPNSTANTLRQVARELRDIVSGRSLRLPKDVMKRGAFEHFLALA
ncbi:site-specific integrase [Pontibaca salina]|uniref:Site-specific integrase n=1 Tax=Pontibaca salina TaxID=2795731 RepID=A0A934M4G9_9RHOB|nr:site-specific integrase [Pontibaca salina]MBI6630899.1 site-specific integrase [Pontibaca salina]